MSDLLRIYDPETELGREGYPMAWYQEIDGGSPTIKEHVRALAGYRCIRCGHPYPPGIAKKYPRGEWTPCDTGCKHGGPMRYHNLSPQPISNENAAAMRAAEPEGTRRGYFEAQWRILTVHHLNGVKWDCRWWNLVALCQRCHLTIQGKVIMENVWGVEHSEWFKPYAAGWYAVRYLDEELSREEVMARLDELLNLELTQEALF